MFLPNKELSFKSCCDRTIGYFLYIRAFSIHVTHSSDPTTNIYFMKTYYMFLVICKHFPTCLWFSLCIVSLASMQLRVSKKVCLCAISLGECVITPQMLLMPNTTRLHAICGQNYIIEKHVFLPPD